MRMPAWIEIDVARVAGRARLTAHGSGGENVSYELSEPVLAGLAAFTRAVGGAALRGTVLDDASLSEARALFDAVAHGELVALMAALQASAPDRRLLVQLLLHDPDLQAVPWEALCLPGAHAQFWGAAPGIVLTRSARSAAPAEPRQVKERVRILAVAPSTHWSALLRLQSVLAESVERGEIEWLDPITEEQAGSAHLFEQLRRRPTPHVLHFLGHGGVTRDGRPGLRLADEDGAPTLIEAEALARELAASFGSDLRLVVLECCEGAAPGALGSAAEAFAQYGAHAVVAQLWPVRADVARACSADFYGALVGSGRAAGDVAESLGAARRQRLASGAEGFSPVLYLRGHDAVIFDFKGRVTDLRTAAQRGPVKNLAPALQSMLQRRFSLVLGDAGSTSDRDELRAALAAYLVEAGDAAPEHLPLSALSERCALRFGKEQLDDLFQNTLLSSELKTQTPPLLAAIGGLLPPGVHVTLLWLPLLKRAVAARQPDRNIHVIQPAPSGGAGLPLVVQRQGGAARWKKTPMLPERFDLEKDVYILRLCGGYPPEQQAFTGALLTEDDYLHGLLGIEGFRPPSWADPLLGDLRARPGLFVGLSVLKWRHRMLLHWLYEQRPAKEGSLALLESRTVDPAELEIWQQGGGLPGKGRITPLREDATELTRALEAFTDEVRR